MTINIKRLLERVLAGRRNSSLMKFASLSILLAVLTACPAPGPECVDSDDWGDKIKATLKVQAKDEFTAAGIKVQADKPITVEISGLIDICPDDTTFKSVAQPILDSQGNVEKTIMPIDAALPKWQRAEILVPAADGKSPPVLQPLKLIKGTKYSIKINGSYTDREGTQTEGKGLYVYIGDKAPVESDPAKTDAQGNWWFGAQGAPQPEANKKTGEGAAYPEFFELWDNGTVGKGAGVSGLARTDGNLWFKYARTASARSLDNNGDGRYSPWLGRYAWDSGCIPCMHTVIISTCTAVAAASGLFFGIVFPACVASWEGSCAGTGHLEEASGLETKAGRYCREHYSGDHWINSKYDGSEGDKYESNLKKTGAKYDGIPNSGGYDISVGVGCLGTYGKYMDMTIGYGKAYLVDKTEPEGCEVGIDNPCDYVKGEFGEVIKVPKYTVEGGSSVSMDMREKLDGQNKNNNPGYVRPGVYKGKVPSSGELWFHIKDNATSMSHPEPGYYDDNQGQYTVKVQSSKVNTGFSDTMDSLINPIRGVIFGYCRNAADPSLKYTLTEAGCGTYIDYNGNKVPAWLPGITKRMYTHLVGGNIDPQTGATMGNPFLSALRAALVLYVIVYAGMFMMGMVEDKQEEFLKRVIRFAIVAVLLTESSWEFFNNYLFTLFYNGVDNFIGIMAGEFTGTTSGLMVDPATGQAIANAEASGASSGHIFAFADITVNKFFQIETIIKIFGLLFASPIGFIYVILIFVGMYFFLFALIQALILYLLAMLAISLLLVVAPIFISFMLFEKTRPLFDSWVKNLINYTLQPIMVFTALAIFNIFVYTAIYTMLQYRVCWGNVWSLSVGSPPLFTVPLLNSYMPDNPVTGASIPIQLFVIFIFLIICNAMMKFIDWMAELAAELTIAAKSTSLAKPASNALNGVVNMAKAAASGGISAAAKGVSGAAANAVTGARDGAKQGGARGAIAGAAMKMVGMKSGSEKKKQD